MCGRCTMRAPGLDDPAITMSSVSGLDTAFHLGILGVVGASVTIGAVNDWSGVVIALVMLVLLVTRSNRISPPALPTPSNMPGICEGSQIPTHHRTTPTEKPDFPSSRAFPASSKLFLIRLAARWDRFG